MEFASEFDILFASISFIRKRLHHSSQRKFTKMSDLVRYWKRLTCLLLVAVVTGCGSKATDSETAPGEGGGAEAAAQAGKKVIIPIRHDVKELEGHWVMVVTGQDRRDKYLWIVNLAKGPEGKIQAEIIDSTSDNSAKIESTTVDGTAVKLTMKNGNAAFDFQGEFSKGAIRGTVASGSQEMYLARLLPTSGSKLSDYLESALPPAADVFEKAFRSMQAQPQPKVILRLASEHPISPISLEAAFGLLAMHAKAGFDDDTLLEIINKYLELSKTWGTRMNTNAEWITAQQLISSGRLPAEAIKHVNAAEKLMGEAGTALKPRFQSMRDQAEIQIALGKSRSKLDEDRASAHEALKAALVKQSYNWDILAALGDYAAANKQPEAAIDYYATIVAMPMLEHLVMARRLGQPPGEPTPTEVLTKLWKEHHGNTDGMEAHLQKLYMEKMTVLKSEIQKTWPVPPEAGDHVSLIEFFTGAKSPPAVATEVALDVIRTTYPANQVVTLRYHQHNPQPDGLVNQDSEDRFAFYEMSKTPTVTVDGAMLDPEQAPYRGFLQFSGTAYSLLRTVVDERIRRKTPIRIALAGKMENGELSVSAEVSGATEEQLPSLRLRLALAEEDVQAPTTIGIRSHAMLVREMPGGARGVAPKKGELKFSFSMPYAELQQHLDDYLKQYEAGNKIEIPANEKPPISGPLYLIAWVQNDKADNEHPEVGRAILQTAIIPVAGLGGKTVTTAPTTAATESTTPPAPALPE